ncbi:MAG TPA: protein kinase, partial [Polyangiales bacterium]|nr:protein kinase [Polyangiales bacterium]
RDLKPDNIFLCDSVHGQLPEAKVLDFGISAIHSATAADSKLTGVGALLGTPAYMSPEQLRDSGSVDPRSDVYAFGVILYEALTGIKPFTADSIGGLVLAIVQDEPEHPCAVRREIPRELAEIVLRAMAKHREARWPDIESLMAALAPYAPGYSAPPAVPETPPRSARGLFGAAIVLALAVVAVWWWKSAPVASRTASPAPELVVRPAAPPETVRPAPPPAASAPEVPAGKDLSEPLTSPTASPEVTAIERVDGPKPARPRVSARVPAPSPPSAAAGARPTAEPPKKAAPARSGRIEMDDL